MLLSQIKKMRKANPSLTIRVDCHCNDIVLSDGLHCSHGKTARCEKQEDSVSNHSSQFFYDYQRIRITVVRLPNFKGNLVESNKEDRGWCLSEIEQKTTPLRQKGSFKLSNSLKVRREW